MDSRGQICSVVPAGCSSVVWGEASSSDITADPLGPGGLGPCWSSCAVRWPTLTLCSVRYPSVRSHLCEEFVAW